MTNNFRSGASEKLRVSMSCASRIARNAGQLQWGDAMAPDKQATLGTALQGYWANSGGHQVSLRKAGPRGRVPAKKPKKQQRMRPGKQFEAVTNPLNDNRPSGIDLWHKIKDKVQQESHRMASRSGELRTQNLGAKRSYTGNGLLMARVCGRVPRATVAQQTPNAGLASALVWSSAYDPVHAIVGGGFGDDESQDLAAMEESMRKMEAEGEGDDDESVASVARSGILGPTIWQSEDDVAAWANTAWREWERIFRSKIRSQTRCRMTSRGKNGYGGQLVFAKG